ncbi:MAG: ATP-binding protein [Sulfuritalea sp.]|nr:ATP-binding protein [Sulfuritalea sp.]
MLNLGGQPIDLSEYATTGLRSLAVGPSGNGKTNAGLLIAEQLSEQGWISVLIDPEGELASMYGAPVESADELRERLTLRDQPIVVVSATDAFEFIPYGMAILDAAEEHRKPLFVFIDEGQLFSAARKRKDGVGDAADIISQFVERGRKRSLDLFVTAHRYTGTLHRTLFANKNLTLVGCQEDPTAWSALAQQFRSSGIEFKDLNALAPGEFFCFSRRGVEKVKMPMCDGLKKVAPKAKTVKRTLPATFSQWDRAMRSIPTERLMALTDPVVELLGAVAGLSPQQMLAGARALGDEFEARA